MLLETLAGALVGAFLQVLFDRIASRGFLNLFKSRKIDPTLLPKLKSILLAVNAVLSDAEEKQLVNLLVKEWLDELKDAVYDAEDVLDEIATKYLLSKLESTSSTLDNKEIESKVRKIVNRLESIAQQKDLLGLREALERKPSLRLPSTSLVDGSEIFGRDNDKEEILQFLRQSCENGIPAANNVNEIPMIAIVGMPGVGKTALAQSLFNDEVVKSLFKTRAWVHVSDEFDILKVTKSIYESVISSDCKAAGLNTLQIKLQEALRNEKFLLVLDDVWNENFDYWDVLRRPFQAGAPGSKIILTTSSRNVAAVMRASRIHPLLPLSYKDCQFLFERYAFRYGEAMAYPDLKRIGEDITKKCKGLPLAAKTLGALLFSKTQIDEWDSLRSSKIWDFPSDKINILPALKLSYYYLPSHLKRCFAYCSIFPKGYVIEKIKLVRLWMAEGLLMQTRSKKRLEDVGMGYCQELVARSFLQQSSGDNSCYEMHDLFNDLAKDVAGEFCFRFHDGIEHLVIEKVRHFSFSAKKDDLLEMSDYLREAYRLRTFLALGPSSIRALECSSTISDDLLPAFIRLRVLSLPYKINILPESIGKLKHLRYLDLSHSIINRLPESVSSLHNLETLLLQKCHSLTNLPANTKNLINLQHLDISSTNNLREMPLEFGSLKNLHLLTDFVVGNSGSKISELKGLSDLQGTLSISNLQNVLNSVDASNADLKKKENLSELSFKWGNNTQNAQNEESVLQELQPHENLKKLTIINYGGHSFPNWLGDTSFSEMVYLDLIGCENCSSLPPLGQLSSLKELHVAKMEKVEKVGPEFFSSSIEPFRSLEILKFENMPKWKVWSSSTVEEQFPCLKELHLSKCPKLTKNLLRRLPSLKPHGPYEETENRYMALKILKITNCNSLISFKLECFTQLEELQIIGCRSLECLYLPRHDCRSLKKLEIQDCCGTVFSPVKEQLRAPNLELLSLSRCNNLKSMPNLNCLTDLSLSECPNLDSIPDGHLPANLKSISIEKCTNLTPHVEWNLLNMAKLESFIIIGGCSSMTSFPVQGLLPTTLTSLHIADLQDLESLDPMGLQDLACLEILEISGCNKLSCISAERLPQSLYRLSIDKCDHLIQWCREADWEGISHNSSIYINGQRIK